MQVQYVSDVKVVDLFESDVLGAGKKSLAFSLSLKASDRTLTDNEIHQSVEKIIHQITLKFKATLRSS